MGSRYLMDSNAVIDYVGEFLPPASGLSNGYPSQRRKRFRRGAD